MFQRGVLYTVCIYILVGGFNPSEKYESVGMMTFPTEWKNNQNVPVTTNQLLIFHYG